ncbi:MAG: Ribonuclease, Rne/Rng family, partial [Verrucomicrobiales bacterium]|nr:Ribonuclease, Rne/Rng family [Verrucomicrobiales bacterium]
MSDRNFSRRRRGGMRFRPPGGIHQHQQPQKSDRAATEARADVLGEKIQGEHVYDPRHENEIERAENIAAGIPEKQVDVERPVRDSGPPAEKVATKPYSQIPVAEVAPQGLMETIKAAATKVLKKV